MVITSMEIPRLKLAIENREQSVIITDSQRIGSNNGHLNDIGQSFVTVPIRSLCMNDEIRAVVCLLLALLFQHGFIYRPLTSGSDLNV